MGSRKRRRLASVGAGVALAIAVSTSPDMIIALPLVVWLMAGSTGPQGNRRTLVVAGSAAFAALVLWASAVLSAGDATASTLRVLDEWLQLDPVLVILGVAASVAALRNPQLRPFAVFALTLAVVIVVPGGLLAASLATIWLPVAILLIAAVGDAAVRTLRFGERGGPLAIASAAFIATGVVLAVPLWTLQSATSVGVVAEDPTRSAQEWFMANASREDRLVVADVMRADLIDAGWDPRAVLGYTPTSGSEPPAGWPRASYVVTSPGSAVAEDSFEAARFGEGDRTIEIRKVSAGWAEDGLPAAIQAAFSRTQLGRELAVNEGIRLDDEARMLLSSGRVDERIVLVLGALAGSGDVTIAGFPVVDGESGRAIRQVALTDLGSGALVRDSGLTRAGSDLIGALVGDYRPESAIPVGGTLVVRYAIDPTQTFG